MSDLATTVKKRPVQIDLSTDLIADIERLAAEETLTRTAWMRRLLHGAGQGCEGAARGLKLA